MGDRADSEQHFRRALPAAMEIQEPALALDVLGSLARNAASAGDEAFGLELVALVRRHPAGEPQTRDRMESLGVDLTPCCPEKPRLRPKRAGGRWTWLGLSPPSWTRSRGGFGLPPEQERQEEAMWKTHGAFAKVLSFVDYCNGMMAKPLKRTYKGKVLAV
jgi:hypothetical protein